MLLDFWHFCWGYAAFRRSGRTPDRAYKALRRLHAKTNGRFNDLWLAGARRLSPHTVKPVCGFLGDWSVDELASLAATVEREGIAVLDRRLPEALCRELEHYARNTPSLPLGQIVPELYHAQSAKALRYDFDPRTLLNQPLAASIAQDGTFAAIAGAYFRSRPQFDFLTMWWTTAKGTRDYSGAAQMFHYDMDRIYFLKFFIYLSDVGPANGPHVYVARSHRRKHAALREDRRFEDADIHAQYPAEHVRTITGARGLIFVADTRGLHKGEPLRHGERLVLQVEYAINRFGQNY